MRVPSGTAGTACPSGRMISAQTSCFWRRSAGSVPAMASESGLPTWTTSWTTKATGLSSSTGATWRASATPATAARPCGTNGRKGEKAELCFGVKRPDAWAPAPVRLMPAPGQGKALPCRTLPPPSECFRPRRSIPQMAVHTGKNPHRGK